MSMLSSQADELRTLADKLRIVSFDERANYVENVDTLYRAMGAMREAADTITSLWNSLTVSEAALNKADSQIRENGGRESNYEKLFGTPEMAARTMALMCECSPECSFCLLSGRAETICGNGDYDALLEWLRVEGGTDEA